MNVGRFRAGSATFHLLCACAVVFCLFAARWQWSVAHRSEADAVPAGAVVDLAELDPAAAFPGMRVRLTGTFDRDAELLVQPRRREVSGRSTPGAWVLTPLRPGGSGAALGVVRGWIPEGEAPTPAPEGVLEVVGVLVGDTRNPGVVPSGSPPALEVVDTGALQAHSGYPVRSGWVAMQAMVPSGVEQPWPLLVAELPGAGLGLNLRNAAYSVQWLVFCGFVLFFWIRLRPSRPVERLDHPEMEVPA
jgi:cytochrome oxidase assembly protein ShyY1